MATTYLELTNKLLRRLNEVTLTETTFPSARNIQASAKDFIVDAVDEIQAREHEWPFNSGTGSQLLTVGQKLYNFDPGTTTVDWESFRIQKDDTLSVNTTPLRFINQDTWYKLQRRFDDNSDPDGLRVPNFVFATNSGGFGVTPSPNQAYTVLYNRFIEPARMEEFDDTTTIPSRFDYVIINFALKHFNMHKDNAEQSQLSDQLAERSLSQMRTMMMNKQDKMEDTRSNYGGLRWAGEYYIDDR